MPDIGSPAQVTRNVVQKMMKRNIIYHLHYSKVLPILPFMWFYRKLILKSGIFTRHRGIIISEISPNKELDPLFVVKTKAALDFLAETDPHRFKRVQRFIKIIIFSNRGLARYAQSLNACLVGFAHYHFENDGPHKIQWYACTLVHEATHGLFHSKRIPYTKQTRERIEYACVMEEWRFAQHFEPDKINWKKHIWSKVINRAWDPVWNENPIHVWRTIAFQNANGELEQKNMHNQRVDLTR